MKIPLAFIALAFTTLVRAEVVGEVRIPDGGIQPQVVTDGKAIHLVYFKGEPLHGDLFYVRSDDEAEHFSKPIRVNSQSGSAIATGSIRGAQIALGRDGRVHVAWNGSNLTKSEAGTPMLYSRLNAAGDAFEPQRNIIHEHYGLDGGGSVAADSNGNVYVAWHAPDSGMEGEGNRRVWIAKSTDDGKAFRPEIAANLDPTGACGCCGLKLLATADGGLFCLYRSATNQIHRDMFLLRSTKDPWTFDDTKIAPMEMNMCVMSSAALVQGKDHVLAGWETGGRVFWGKIRNHIEQQFAALQGGKNQKYPSLAENENGNVMLAWAQDTSWGQGGSVRWQIWDTDGKPIVGHTARFPVPAWSFPAVVAIKGGFILFY